jgi:hypothetical protein
MDDRRRSGRDPVLSWLVLGDLLVHGLTTFLGFASHGELEISSAGRMLATFFPFTAAWFLIAPWLGLFRLEEVRAVRQAWRAPLAAVYAAPLGAILRALWLRTPVLPLFVIIMAGVNAGIMLAWRAAYAALLRRGDRALR